MNVDIINHSPGQAANSNLVERIFSGLAEKWSRARALIVVAHSGSLGDVLQLTPLLHHLRHQFVGARIAVLHVSGAAPTLLEECAFVDDVYITHYDIQRDLIKQLVRFGCVDLVVAGQYIVEYFLPPQSRLNQDEADFVRAIQPVQKQWLPLKKDHPHHNDKLWVAAVEAGMNLYGLMAHTAGFQGADFEQLHIQLQAADYSLRSELPEKYVVLCNSAETLTVSRSRWTKALPVEKMERVTDRIRDLGVTTVLLGESTSHNPIRTVDIDLRGHTTLRQAAAILEASETFVAPEGGIANLATAVGKKGVVFFGSTPPLFFGIKGNINIAPKTCGGCWWTTPSYLYQCPRLLHTPACVESIAEDEIVDAVKGMLS